VAGTSERPAGQVIALEGSRSDQLLGRVRQLETGASLDQNVDFTFGVGSFRFE
jgi:hypothetical protein